MADQDEDDLRMALRLSMQNPSTPEPKLQNSPPEPKRSKPRDAAAVAGGGASVSPDDSRRLQRELMAAAAEKRMQAAKIASPSKSATSSATAVTGSSAVKTADSAMKEKDGSLKECHLGRELSMEEANQLFSMVFGAGVSKGILAQWSNQGIRFSSDPETSMGLVQHEGGPCGVLATIQCIEHITWILWLKPQTLLGSICGNACLGIPFFASYSIVHGSSIIMFWDMSSASDPALSVVMKSASSLSLGFSG